MAVIKETFLMKAFFFIFILLPLSANSTTKDDWKVLSPHGYDHLLRLTKTPSIQYKLRWIGGNKPRIIEVRNYKGNKHEVIVYDSGSAGTKYLVQENRGVIFDTESKKFLQDHIISSKCLSGAPSCPSFLPKKFHWYPDPKTGARIITNKP